jgi:O-succinylbenzoic acid--CoA ligase
MRHVVAIEVEPDPLGLVEPLRQALTGAGPAVLPVAAGQSMPELLGELAAAEDSPDDPTALVVATSGSTGAPKGVLLSAGALHASALATHRRLGGPGRWLLATPARYIGGIQVLVRSMLAGTEPGVVDLSGGFRPELFVESARSVLATAGRHYTALVPTQLTRLIDAGGAAVAALRAFDAIVIGGAATPPALRRRAAESGITIVPAYGMSETASGCVYDGVPLDGVSVRLGTDQRIELAGPMLARGYRGQPELTGASFVDGWFATADRGRFAEDGRLEVLGRIDDVINTGGVKVSAADVERILAEQPQVNQACVVGIPDQEWGELVAAAIVPTETSVPPSGYELRMAVIAAMGSPAGPRRIRFMDELPLIGPGKPDRAEVRTLLSTD